MIPLSDDNSLRKNQPIINYLLIALNVVVFLLELAGGEEFIVKWSFTPNDFTHDPIANIPTIFTSMFMHGGWAHLIGNMLYLWIFGDNVEDYFGKFKYLVFYLFCGIAATFSQYIFNSTSTVPNLGASGAIAGVLGAYFILWPKGKIKVLFVRSVTEMPAIIVIGFWFVLQFISSFGSLSSTEEEGGGVAYMAHVGGFIIGLLLTLLHKFIFRYKV